MNSTDAQTVRELCNCARAYLANTINPDSPLEYRTETVFREAIEAAEALLAREEDTETLELGEPDHISPEAVKQLRSIKPGNDMSNTIIFHD